MMKTCRAVNAFPEHTKLIKLMKTAKRGMMLNVVRIPFTNSVPRTPTNSLLKMQNVNVVDDSRSLSPSFAADSPSYSIDSGGKYPLPSSHLNQLNSANDFVHNSNTFVGALCRSRAILSRHSPQPNWRHMERDSNSDKVQRIVAEVKESTLQWRKRSDESQSKESAVSDLPVDQIAEHEHLQRTFQ